jgi:hypothetical protein
VKDDEKALHTFLFRTHGFFSLEYHIQAYCLACDVEIPKAMAYGAFAGLVHFLSSFFITKDHIQKVARFRAFSPFGLYSFRRSSLQ